MIVHTSDRSRGSVQMEFPSFTRPTFDNTRTGAWSQGINTLGGIPLRTTRASMRMMMIVEERGRECICPKKEIF